MLSIQSLSLNYGHLLALDDVSINIGSGEFIALLGPSGCGKTTLLRCIGGFAQPTQGDIKINGQSMVGVPAFRRPVNTVFQSYALFPHMTIAENVAYGPKRNGVKATEIPDRVREALEMVNLSHVMDRYPGQLSGGQQQRVALARAIVNRPRLLLLDEPLGALDLKLRRQMQLELKGLQEQLGTTFVFVTHDQEEALVMADRIAVMNAGKVEQMASGEEIYNRPASRFVADFIGEANLLTCSVNSGFLYFHGQPESIAPADKPDGRYSLLATPEQIRVGETGPGVSFEGIFKRKVYMGDAVRAFFEIPDGTEISAKLAADDPAIPSLRANEHTKLTLRHSEPVLFPMEG